LSGQLASRRQNFKTGTGLGGQNLKTAIGKNALGGVFDLWYNLTAMKYWLEHEKKIKAALAGKKGQTAWRTLYEQHLVKTKLLQHERLIHLLVTLAFGLFALLSFFTVFILNQVIIIIPAALFLATAFVYVIHYYRLENMTLRWYKLADQLAAKLK
jgi:hypothetical protein